MGRRSLTELRTRGAQATAAWLERAGWPMARGEAPLQLAEFQQRQSPRFFPAFDDLQATAAAVRQNWPAAERRLVARADRIRQGRFDLLGYQDLSFGRPIDWHLDPVAGLRAPLVHWSRIPYLDAAIVGDHKVIWELNRHQYFATLGQAYWLTGDEAYADTFAEHLAGWMGANPPKLGINWASSLEVAFRAISWLWGLYLFRQSTALTAPLFERALSALHLHGKHLATYLSTYFSPNTHLTGEALGLFYLGLLVPEFHEASCWRRLGIDILTRELNRQIRADGVYFEQASYYQRYTADFYLHLTILADVNGIPLDPAVRHALTLVLDHLAHLTRPDGTTPLVGDDDGGQLMPLDVRAVNDFRATLGVGTVVLGRPDYCHAANGSTPEAVWLLGAPAVVAARSIGCRPPAATSRGFREGGCFVMRDGWDSSANQMVLDCGPHGGLSGGHAHDDALAFELVAEGQPLLVDAGTFTYTALPEWRDHFRSSLAHNTVAIAGQPASVPAGPFRWQRASRGSLLAWVSHSRLDYFEGCHDGYTRLDPPAVHQRGVLFIKGGFWIVRDRIISEGAYPFAVRLQCAPGVRPTLDSRCSLTLSGPGPGAQLAIKASAPGGAFAVEDGWVSAVYGAKEPAAMCVFTVPADGDGEAVTVLMPWRARQPVVRIDRLPPPASCAVVVEADGRTDQVLIGRGAALSADDVETDAEWTWIRRDRAGEPTDFCLIGGRRLIIGSRQIAAAPSQAGFMIGQRTGDRWRVESGERLR